MTKKCEVLSMNTITDLQFSESFLKDFGEFLIDPSQWKFKQTSYTSKNIFNKVASIGLNKGLKVDADAKSYALLPKDIKRKVKINSPTQLDLAFRNKSNRLLLAFESEINDPIEKIKKEELQRLFDLCAKVKILSCWSSKTAFGDVCKTLEGDILRMLSESNFDGFFGLIVYTDNIKNYHIILYSNKIKGKKRIIFSTLHL